MKLYLLSQEENRGYDTYDSCVVAAESEEEAKKITPSSFRSAWAYKPENVYAELIGIAIEGIESGVICASFNAG